MEVEHTMQATVKVGLTKCESIEENFNTEEIQAGNIVKIESLRDQITEAKNQIKIKEAILEEHKNKLQEFLVKKHKADDILLESQLKAKRIEENAMEMAQFIIIEAVEKLREKQLELENIRVKANELKGCLG